MTSEAFPNDVLGPVLSPEDVRPTLRRRIRLLRVLGPAFVASVAFVDPGNFATNIDGGSRFGYTLVWVVVAASLMAMYIQALSAKLGLATGRNLAEICRDEFSRPASIGLWLQAEAISVVTDLAEVVGAAVGLHLLTGLPLFPSALLVGVATFAILSLDRFGFRTIELVIAAILAVIGVSYVIELFFAQPPLETVARHAVVPSFAGTDSVLLAVGIVGATMMPHVIYLHSALTQRRIVPKGRKEQRRLSRFTHVDVVIALSIAMLINVAMLVMAASVFHDKGLGPAGSFDASHATLVPALGSAAATLFALALLAAGLSSSVVGTMSGQIVMQGFIHRRIPLVARRLVTLLPALVVIGIGADPMRSLVISQVVLAFGIPFAAIPLVIFTSRRDLMGRLVNRRSTTALAVAITAAVCVLNALLIVLKVAG
jgi:manganese transport protein